MQSSSSILAKEGRALEELATSCLHVSDFTDYMGSLVNI